MTKKISQIKTVEEFKVHKVEIKVVLGMINFHSKETNPSSLGKAVLKINKAAKIVKVAKLVKLVKVIKMGKENNLDKEVKDTKVVREVSRNKEHKDLSQGSHHSKIVKMGHGMLNLRKQGIRIMQGKDFKVLNNRKYQIRTK